MEKNHLSINYDKYSLSNGLEVILYPDNSLPVVSVNIWYKVGSANEIKGKSGFAHLFEHMMFQGSQNVPKEMHFRYIQEAGGTLNGSTSFDRTNYFETVPSNFLEMALWLESDRMGFFLPALTQEKLSNQIDVVKNERLQRYDNQPYGLTFEKLLSNLFPSNHPYGNPTIGWMEDILNIKIDEVKQFFVDYYSPSNAMLTIAGSFDNEKAKQLVDNYFGDIPSSGNPITVTNNFKGITENKLVIHEDNVQLDRIYFAWKTSKAFENEDSCFDIFADLLTGSKNGRLYKTLVYEKEIAQDVSSFQYSGKYDGMFIIIATAKPGFSLNQIKQIIFEELNNIIEKGIIEEELTRSKNGVKSSFIYSMQNITALANHINHYNFYLGEPNSFEYDLQRYQLVSSEGIIKAAAKLLNNNFVELRVIPKEK